MSDVPNVASVAGGEATPAPAAVTEEKVAAPVKTIIDGAADGANAADTSTEAADWRTGLAGGDEALLKQLNRFASPENFVKAYRELQTKLRTGQTAAALPDGATPEEVAAHRKALGIPDKPEGYGLAYPAELKPTEGDLAGLNAWAAYAHEQHLPPAAAKAGAEFYSRMEMQRRAAREEAALEAKIQNIAELRSEWKGREFTRNITIADEFLVAHGADFAPELVQRELADGTKLGDDKLFIRLMAAAGRATADEQALIGGDGAGGGKSLDDEYQELVAKPKLSAAEHKRVLELAEARHAREQRQGRGRAA